jgi:hypothetical protein
MTNHLRHGKTFIRRLFIMLNTWLLLVVVLVEQLMVVAAVLAVIVLQPATLFQKEVLTR